MRRSWKSVHRKQSFTNEEDVFLKQLMVSGCNGEEAARISGMLANVTIPFNIRSIGGLSSEILA